MQVALGGGIKNFSRTDRGFFTRMFVRQKNDDVEFRLKCWNKSLVVLQSRVELDSRFPSCFKPPRKFSTRHQWKQFLRCPERCGRRPWSRALQTNLAQMQFGRTEIRVRRLVFIQFAHARIAK